MAKMVEIGNETAYVTLDTELDTTDALIMQISEETDSLDTVKLSDEVEGNNAAPMNNNKDNYQ